MHGTRCTVHEHHVVTSCVRRHELVTSVAEVQDIGLVGDGVVLTVDIDMSWRCANVRWKPHLTSTYTRFGS